MFVNFHHHNLLGCPNLQLTTALIDNTVCCLDFLLSWFYVLFRIWLPLVPCGTDLLVIRLQVESVLFTVLALPVCTGFTADVATRRRSQIFNMLVLRVNEAQKIQAVSQKLTVFVSLAKASVSVLWCWLYYPRWPQTWRMISDVQDVLIGIFRTNSSSNPTKIASAS